MPDESPPRSKPNTQFPSSTTEAENDHEADAEGEHPCSASAASSASLSGKSASAIEVGTDPVGLHLKSAPEIAKSAANSHEHSAKR